MHKEEKVNTGVQMAYVDETPSQLPPYGVLTSDKWNKFSRKSHDRALVLVRERERKKKKKRSSLKMQQAAHVFLLQQQQNHCSFYLKVFIQADWRDQ